MHLTILTGASRGLGHAVADQLLARGHTVLALSRRPPARVPIVSALWEPAALFQTGRRRATSANAYREYV